MKNDSSLDVKQNSPRDLQPVQDLEVWLTREGAIYLTVLLFVATGAILRSVNLLIFMAGMMCAPLFLNWRILRHYLRYLRARRIFPHRIHAGQLINIQWEVQNLSQRVTAWNIVVEDKLQQVDRADDMSETTPPALPESIPDQPEDAQGQRNRRANRRPRSDRSHSANQTGSWLSFYTPRDYSVEQSFVSFVQVGTGASEFRSYRCLFTKRGVYKLGPAKISSVFPLGIMRGTAHIKEPIQIIVAPPIGTLSAHWEQRLRSSALGNEAVNRQLGNNEEEFYAIRGWRSGDNQRHIHWRSTAKRGKPMVRQFDQKSNRDLGLVLDLHAAGLNDPLAGTSRESSLALCETALSFAATILAQTQSTIKGTISVGISGAGSKIITDRHWHDLNNRVMRELALARAGSSNDLEPIIAQVVRSVSSGTPIYVVSSRTQPDSILAAFGNTKFAKQIRWLKTDSDEFHRLFHMDRKSDQQQWEQLQERWVTHAED